MNDQIIPLDSIKVKRPPPLGERERSVEDGVPFPQAAPITVPEGAKGIHNLYCLTTDCGFYTVSPYTAAEWRELGRDDKFLCPVCESDLQDEKIKMPMRVTDRIPVIDMTTDVEGLLGKGRHARWDYEGGAGYYNRMVINKGARDERAWKKMEQWAAGGSTADEVVLDKPKDKVED